MIKCKMGESPFLSDEHYWICWDKFTPHIKNWDDYNDNSFERILQGSDLLLKSESTILKPMYHSDWFQDENNQLLKYTLAPFKFDKYGKIEFQGGRHRSRVLTEFCGLKQLPMTLEVKHCGCDRDIYQPILDDFVVRSISDAEVFELPDLPSKNFGI